MTMTVQQELVDESCRLSPADRAKVDESGPPLGVAREPSSLEPKQAGETYEIGA